MCYICRKGIRQEKYKHFCPHPRNPGQLCAVCDKCDLWRSNDEPEIAKAKAQAKADWLNAHPELHKAQAAPGPQARHVAGAPLSSQKRTPVTDKSAGWTLGIWTEKCIGVLVGRLPPMQP